jgi:hypothetical protein
MRNIEATQSESGARSRSLLPKKFLALCLCHPLGRPALRGFHDRFTSFSKIVVTDSAESLAIVANFKSFLCHNEHYTLVEKQADKCAESSLGRSKEPCQSTKELSPQFSTSVSC